MLSVSASEKKASEKVKADDGRVQGMNLEGKEMSGNRRLFYRLSCLILGLVMMITVSMTGAASDHTTNSKDYLDGWKVGVTAGISNHTTSSKDYLDTLNVGVTTVLDSGAGKSVSDTEYAKSTIPENFTANGMAGKAEEKEESDLVMADVQNALNVRAEADEESEKVGLLYKDCGGRILERKDGWTKIKSGDLIGWAKDDYLLFNEEAESLAGEVGNLIVTIETDALRVRKEPSMDSGIFALIAQDDELDVVEVVNDEWISVDYKDEIGYVSAEFVDMDFHIDTGETIETIRAREKAEAEAKAKAKLTANQGAVAAGADDTRLLAALIYCEAGNQGYEGQLAVGAAVMNRVRSGAYPNSISGVIYASGQFTPALNGRVAKVYAGNIPESCFTAAQESLNGATNIGSATHFRRVGAHEGIIIGDHVFW